MNATTLIFILQQRKASYAAYLDSIGQTESARQLRERDDSLRYANLLQREEAMRRR